MFADVRQQMSAWLVAAAERAAVAAPRTAVRCADLRDAVPCRQGFRIQPVVDEIEYVHWQVIELDGGLRQVSHLFVLVAGTASG